MNIIQDEGTIHNVNLAIKERLYSDKCLNLVNILKVRGKKKKALV
jgi:hypothetical protein